MFDIFDSPILYRRVPSLFQVARAMQRQRMLEDLFFSDFDVPEMYFYFTSSGSKTNKKSKKTRAEKKLANAQKEQEAKSEDTPKEEIPSNEEKFSVEDKKQDEAPKAPEETVSPVETEKSDVEAPKAEEKAELSPVEEEKTKSEEVQEPIKISPAFSEELPKFEEAPILEQTKEEPETSIKHSKSEELPKLEEKKVIEQKPKEVVPAKPVEDGDEFTCETRTITKKGGFKHVIRTERNESTGIIIVTETREIGDKSMSLKRVMYPDGEVESFESKKNLSDEDLEEFKANWIKAFPVE